MNIFTQEFKEKFERENENDKITKEQLEAEYALLQETRELFSRLEIRVSRPQMVMKIQKVNKQLEWMQNNIRYTLEEIE